MTIDQKLGNYDWASPARPWCSLRPCTDEVRDFFIGWGQHNSLEAASADLG